MTTTKDALQSAIDYLGAVEVEAREPHPFTRYAMPTPSGRWAVFSGGTLVNFADGALNHFRYQVTIGRAFVLMPAWWTPERKTAAKCRKCAVVVKGGQAAATHQYSHPRSAHMFDAITADLETGAEIPA